MKGTGSIAGNGNSTSVISNTSGRNLTGFPFFLTAYDPSDLPGGSLDPMGFERGYLFLADKILPGLTNVADRPRYFSVICAGTFLADVAPHDPPRLQYQARLESILRFERFWALANVLATQKAADTGELSDSGIRGVTYARDEVESLIRKGTARTAADYKMLSRQVPYGVIGIYGAVADGMRLVDRKTFTLTPDLGERLAEGFLDETEIPQVLKKAIRDGGDVPIKCLTEWGKRAHVSGPSVPVEVHCFRDVLNQNPVRARMAAALAANPFQDSGDNELQRLSRVLPGLQSEPANRDLAEAVRAILAYEECYRLIQLGFERLLWLCRNLPAASITNADKAKDDVLSVVRSQLPAAATRLNQSLDNAESELFRLDLQRLEDTRRCVERAATCDSNVRLATELMERHADVQRGKFDRGRRKMAWLETTNSRISLTTTRVGGLDREATVSKNIFPHPYRLPSADALIAASEEA